ncbi:MAG TPA: hypothetical protein VM686_10760 [Polyangiaceae bacterium]|nr:hypothetical protein [Polyangiaceae bacterium]
MLSLREQLGAGEKRDRLIEDGLKVLDDEVADKGGISGLAVKGAYKVVKSIKPGFLKEVVDHLLDDFLESLNPIYQEAAEQKKLASRHLVDNSGRAADALLAVTDKRAAKAQRAVIKSTYEKLRPMAKKQVEAAAPRMGQLLDRHAAPTS